MNLLKNLAISAIIVIFGQLCCYYLYWVSGYSWESAPRVGLTMTCGFVLVISLFLSGLVWVEREAR